MKTRREVALYSKQLFHERMSHLGKEEICKILSYIYGDVDPFETKLFKFSLHSYYKKQLESLGFVKRSKLHHFHACTTARCSLGIRDCLCAEMYRSVECYHHYAKRYNYSEHFDSGLMPLVRPIK